MLTQDIQVIFYAFQLIYIQDESTNGKFLPTTMTLGFELKTCGLWIQRTFGTQFAFTGLIRYWYDYAFLSYNWMYIFIFEFYQDQATMIVFMKP